MRCSRSPSRESAGWSRCSSGRWRRVTSGSSGSKRVLVVATGNPGKARELLALLAGIPFEIRTLADYPPSTMPEETGDTYEANARIKAEASARHTGALSLGDDSGIEVDALGGAPGV